jgi:hypothetical protein
MCSATSGPQHEVMQTIDTNQRVADRRAAREAEAQNHRIVEHTDEPVSRQPRLRYQRRRRTPVVVPEPLD